MTPKQKADELVNKYEKYLYNKFTLDEQYVNCVECALIAVDEILNAIDWNYYEGRMELEQNYWQLVREEIDKL